MAIPLPGDSKEVTFDPLSSWRSLLGNLWVRVTCILNHPERKYFRRIARLMQNSCYVWTPDYKIASLNSWSSFHTFSWTPKMYISAQENRKVSANHANHHSRPRYLRPIPKVLAVAPVTKQSEKYLSRWIAIFSPIFRNGLGGFSYQHTMYGDMTSATIYFTHMWV